MNAHRSDQTERTITQPYSFGDVRIIIDADGCDDRPQEMLDFMIATASVTSGVETMQHGLSSSTSLGEPRVERYKVLIEVGEDIKLNIGVEFVLKSHVSRRQLNDIFFSGLLPLISEAAGKYLGDNQDYTTPAQPLSPVPRSESRWATRQSMGIIPSKPSVYDTPEEAQSGRRSYQPQLTH